jgi:hypothetical protein
MRTVRLGERFDAVLCLFDSINHLLHFREWEQVFDTAALHLAPEGAFVFDVNTVERLRRLVEGPAVAERFGEGGVLVVDVTGGRGGTADWRLQVFERVAGTEYRLHEETIPEIAFPVERIRTALAARFGRVDEHDQAGRLYLVCTDPGALA